MSLTIGGKAPALPVGSLILVTGANSFIGSHVCDQLLERGYRVRGSVRSAARSAWMTSLFDQKYGNGMFSLIEVPDLSGEAVFDELCRGPAGVAHVGNMSVGQWTNFDPSVMLPELMASSKQFLLSALKPGSTVKRFVFTSSSGAVYTPSPDAVVPRTITPHDFNVGTVLKAWQPPPYTPDRRMALYGAAKVQLDHELLEYMRKQRDTDLVLNVVNPDTNWGKSLAPEPSSTGKIVLDAWTARDASVLALFAYGGYRWYVNVADTARLHVAGLIDPDVKNERILAYATKYSGHVVREDFWKFQRELGEKESIGQPADSDWDCIDEVDNSRSTELLKRLGRDGWVGREETLRENIGL